MGDGPLGIPTEAVLKEMREADPPVRYLVGTPRAKMRKMEQQWLDLPWRKVRDSVSVKLAAEGGEMSVLAKSAGRQAKEMAMRRKKLAGLLWKLRAMRRSCPARDQLLLRLGAAKSAAGRAFGFVEIQLLSAKQAVTRETFTFRVRKEKLREAELVDGHYLLRSNQMGEEPAVLWERYIQLTQVEAAFKSMKGKLGTRPIFHQLQGRVEAHVFVAFRGYCWLVTLKSRLAVYAPGLTPKAVLEKLGKIQMIDVWFPTTDGRIW